MYKFSNTSLKRLNTCHPDLQRLANELIKHIDFTIIEGERSVEKQKSLVISGASKTMNSKHIKDPKTGKSHAFDIAIYPIKWGDGSLPSDIKDRHRNYAFAGFVLGVAAQLGIKLRWGGDWNDNWEFNDQSFDDVVHFELV